MQTQTQKQKQITEVVKETLREIKEKSGKEYIVTELKMTVESCKLPAWKIEVNGDGFISDAFMTVSIAHNVNILAVWLGRIDGIDGMFKSESDKVVIRFAEILGLFEQENKVKTYKCKEYWLNGGGFSAIRCKSNENDIIYLLFYPDALIAIRKISPKKVLIVKVEGIESKTIEALQLLFNVET